MLDVKSSRLRESISWSGFLSGVRIVDRFIHMATVAAVVFLEVTVVCHDFMAARADFQVFHDVGLSRLG